jgi:hypothetical protein
MAEIEGRSADYGGGRPPLPELRLQSYNWTAGHYLQRSDDPDSHIFDLDAPYQRGAVWTVEQKRALIKSLTMGVPVGAIIYANIGVRTPKPYRVIDGQQRIRTVLAWVNGEFVCPGWWFRDEHLRRPSDRGAWVFYGQMSDYYHRHFEMSTPLPALEFDSQREFLGWEQHPHPSKPTESINVAKWRDRTPEEMLRAEAEVYLLINMAGTDQTADDILRAQRVAGGHKAVSKEAK